MEAGTYTVSVCNESGHMEAMLHIFNVNSQLRSIVIPITSIWEQETNNLKTDVIILHMEGNVNYVNCQLTRGLRTGKTVETPAYVIILHMEGIHVD